MEAAPLYSEIARGPEGGEAFWVKSADGVRLRMAIWPAQGTPKGSVLLFPGRTEYIEKYGPTAGELAAAGFATASIDWRGQGLSPRICPDEMTGHVPDFADFQQDVQALLELARARDLPRPWHLLAHSMGGCIGLRALHEGLPVERAVFSAPMWGILIPPLQRPVANLLSAVLARTSWGCMRVPGTTRETYVLSAPFEDNQLTHDRGMWDFMVDQARRHPELALGGPSVSWLHAALVETRALMEMEPPDTDCLTFLGTHERIVDTRPVKAHMERWQGGRLELMTGAEHEMLMEGGRLRAHFYGEMIAHFAMA